MHREASEPPARQIRFVLERRLVAAGEVDRDERVVERLVACAGRPPRDIYPRLDEEVP